MHAKLSTKRYSKKCFTLLLFSTHLTPLTTEAAINYSSIQSLYHRHSIYFFILTHSWRSSRFALLFANLHCSKFLIFSLFPFIRQLFLLFIVGRLDLAFQMWRQRHVFMSHTHTQKIICIFQIISMFVLPFAPVQKKFFYRLLGWFVHILVLFLGGVIVGREFIPSSWKKWVKNNCFFLLIVFWKSTSRYSNLCCFFVFYYLFFIPNSNLQRSK